MLYVSPFRCLIICQAVELYGFKDRWIETREHGYLNQNIELTIIPNCNVLHCTLSVCVSKNNIRLICIIVTTLIFALLTLVHCVLFLLSVCLVCRCSTYSPKLLPIHTQPPLTNHNAKQCNLTFCKKHKHALSIQSKLSLIQTHDTISTHHPPPLRPSHPTSSSTKPPPAPPTHPTSKPTQHYHPPASPSVSATP